MAARRSTGPGRRQETFDDARGFVVEHLHHTGCGPLTAVANSVPNRSLPRAAEFDGPRARRFQLRARGRRSPGGIGARCAGQDRTRYNIEEMIGAWGERGLIAEPRKRR